MTAHPFDAVVGLPTINVNEITLGDSLESCERIPAKTVDLILEDMPYNTTACEWDVKIDLQLYWETRLRILKPTGAIVLTASQPFTSELVMSNRKMFKYEWIWGKSKSGSGFTAKYRPVNKHENILIFAKGKTIYHPQLTVGKPYSRDHKITECDINNHNIGFNKRHVKTINDGYRHPITIQYFQQQWRRQDQLHPTQKPVGLFEYLIRTYSNEGDLVFDGFGGSGTTAVAAHKSKRNFIVIEKEQKYFDLAIRRLANERT